MNKKRSIIIAALLLIAAIAGWYFLYFTKTPAYSLNLVRESVQKHDVNAFKQHVDVDAFISSTYDDIMEFTIENSEFKDNPLSINFAKGLIAMIKPAAAGAIKEELLKAVEKGSWQDEKNTGTTDSTAQKPAAPSQSNQIVEKSGLKSVGFQGIEYTKKDGTTALVGIKIHEQTLGTSYVLDIQMRELDNGSWQVTGIANLKDYLQELQKAKENA